MSTGIFNATIHLEWLFICNTYYGTSGTMHQWIAMAFSEIVVIIYLCVALMNGYVSHNVDFVLQCFFLKYQWKLHVGLFNAISWLESISFYVMMLGIYTMGKVNLLLFDWITTHRLANGFKFSFREFALTVSVMLAYFFIR